MGFATLSQEGVDAGELPARGKARRKAGRFRTLPESRRLLAEGGRLFGRVPRPGADMDGDEKGNFGPFPAKPPRTGLLLLKNLANRKSPMTYPARVLSMGLFQKRLAARRAGRPYGRRCRRIGMMDTEKRANAAADEAAD